MRSRGLMFQVPFRARAVDQERACLLRDQVTVTVFLRLSVPTFSPSSIT